MTKKFRFLYIIFIILQVFCFCLYAQVQTYEYIDQNISDILFIFSTQLGKPVAYDTTVTGRTTFQLAGTDAQKAFDTFLEANRLFACEKDGVCHVSKIAVTQNEDGTVNIQSFDSTPSQIIERIALVTGTSITYETLPPARNTFVAENAGIRDALEMMLRPYSEYTVASEDGYYFVRRGSPAESDIFVSGTRLEIQKDEGDEETYSAFIEKAYLKDVLKALFEGSGRDYVNFAGSGAQIERLSFSGRSFEDSLSLAVKAGSAEYSFADGIFYIFQLDGPENVRRIKEENREPHFFKLRYSRNPEVLPLFTSRFPHVTFYEVQGKNGFVASVPESEKQEIEDFVSLVDVPKDSTLIKLKYIRAQDLMENLPPSVRKEDIVPTGNNSSVFYTGSPENVKLFLEELEAVDVPRMRVRYDMLIVQYQNSANLQQSSSFETDRLVPGDKNLITGFLGNLLNLKFDVITVFGHLFAFRFNSALQENRASVFADTTLHGVSGETIQFKNTSTYRYRDSTIDPETLTPKYTGVTREIISGLVVEINGWVSGDGMITTTVTASVSKQGVDVSATTGNPPPTSEKMITTQVRCRSGEPVILSGLTQNDSTGSKEGSPLLSKIPVLGKLFSSTANTDERSETVIYLVPHLEKDSFLYTNARDIPRIYSRFVSPYLEGKEAAL